MKTITMAILLLLIGIAINGCGEGFPDEEMHLGTEDKTRPYAVVVEPPEAAPGDTVLVTLLAQTPDPDNLDITWRVAQDFNTGLYETDGVERNFLDLNAPLPGVDGDGFLTQSFEWVVPDDALLLSSSIPEVLTDPTMVLLAEELIGPEAGSPPTKTAVDAWLKELTVEQMNEMGLEEKMATYALADRFACQVRFRGALQSNLSVDVTRNLTIRHTARLQGPNTNNNASVYRFGVVALDKVDATDDDIDQPGVSQIWYPFIEDGFRIDQRINVPMHESWTYYLVVDFYHEQYSSPFNPELILSEQGSYRWYYYRQDNPVSEHQLFVDDEGEDAEMWNLNREARIMPDKAGSTFRLVSAVRDDRADWVMYNAVPGLAVEEGIVEFVAP